MKCAVHPEVDATGFCRNCGKALCGVCARPVREVLYCEDCLASSMGMHTPASQPSTVDPPPPYAYTAPLPPPRSGKGTPAVAFMLGLFPGLGAVYNGEYNKALIHIVVFCALIFGLTSGEDLSAGAYTVLGILLGGFVLYMAFDAMRVAQAKGTGEASTDPLEGLGKNWPVGPIVLIGVGALILLSNFRFFEFFHLSLSRLWPLILIAVGVLMFRNRLGRQ
jgi:hypothetical protein